MTPFAVTPCASTGPGGSSTRAVACCSRGRRRAGRRTVRDTHWPGRPRVRRGRRRGRAPAVPALVHRGIAGAVYAGVGAGLRAASRGLDAVADRRRPRLEDSRRAVPAPRGQRAHRRPARRGAAGAGDPDGGAPAAARRGARRRRPCAAAYPGPRGASWCSCTACARTSLLGPGRRPLGTTYAEALAAAGLDPGLAARQHRPRPARQRRRPGRAAAATRRRVAGRGRRGSRWWATRWAAWCPGRRAPSRPAAGPAVDRPGHRRGDPRHPAPRRPSPAGVGHGQPRPGPAARDRRVRADPRLALGGRPRPRAGLAEDVPPLPHARYRLVAATLTRSAAAPGGARGRATSGPGARRRTAATARRRAVPGRRRAARGRRRPLRPAQPPARCHDGAAGDAWLAGAGHRVESAVGEQGRIIAWNCPCCG